MKSEDRKFLEILREKQWVEPSKLSRMMAIFQEFSAMGVDTTLAEFLLARKVLSKEQVQQIQREMREQQSIPQEELGDSVDLLQSADLLSETTWFPSSPKGTGELKLGDSFGKYRIIGKIGKGGMGTVYEAWDNTLKRSVAMKVLTKSNINKKTITRFISEAQATAQLQHPNIISIHDIGWTPSERPFFTMDIVHGSSLETILEGLTIGDEELTEAYPLSRLLQIFLKICEGVSYAHSKGVIHRDLKPENIMVGAFGEVYIMDWGLAKFLKSAHSGVWTERQEEAWTTQAGSIVGTPIYMAPEQARGEVDKVDERTDVYALGAILYEMITLRPPFEGSSLEEVYHKVLYTQPPHPRSVCLGERPDEEISAIALKALSKSQVLRYQTVEELKRDVQNYLAGKPIIALEDNLYLKGKRVLKRYRKHLLGFACGIALILAWILTHREAPSQATLFQLKAWKEAYLFPGSEKVETLFQKAIQQAKNREKQTLMQDLALFYLYQGNVKKAEKILKQENQEKSKLLLPLLYYYKGRWEKMKQALKHLAQQGSKEQKRLAHLFSLIFSRKLSHLQKAEKELSSSLPSLWKPLVKIEWAIHYGKIKGDLRGYEILSKADRELEKMRKLRISPALLRFLLLRLTLAKYEIISHGTAHFLPDPTSLLRRLVPQILEWETPDSGYFDYLRGKVFHHLRQYRERNQLWDRAKQKDPDAPWVEKIQLLRLG